MRNFHKIILTLFTLIFALSISVANAQNTEQTTKKASAFSKYLYVNGNLGIVTFWGDIADKKDLLKEPEFGFGFNLGYQLSPIIGTRLNMTSGKTKSTLDHLFYDGSFTDLSVQLTVDLTNLLYKNNNDKLNLYGFGGVGAIMYSGNSAVPIPGNSHFLTGDFDGTAFVFPAGLGLKYSLTDNLDVTFEGSFHYTSTDKLEEANAADWGLDEPFYKMDAIKYVSLGLTYKLSAGGISKMIKNSGSVIYKVTPAVLQEKGDKVPYEVTVTFGPKYFAKNAAVNVAPILKYGDQELALASQIFIGENVSGKGQMVPYETGGTYTYKGEFDYIPEMASSTVVLNPVVYIPKTGMENAYKNLTAAQFKIADGIIHTEDWAGGNENILIGNSGYELETILTGTANLYFPVNLFNYNKQFGLNKTDEVSAARTALYDFLAQDLVIKEIAVDAYASPEGEETFNENLSENRAKTGDKYIKNELKRLKNTKNVTINVVGHGPDWEGFMTALAASDIADKSTILNVIKSAAPAKKESEIKNMILIYPELENILSPLRRTRIDVLSLQLNRNDAEITRLATTNPSELSRQELLYAATLTQNKDAQKAIYKSAASLYPKCWVAQSNYAQTEILDGNVTNGLSYLEKADQISPNNAVVLNNMGVAYAKLGQWDKAKKSFTDAQNLGAEENYNLGVTAIQFGEYEKALSLFGTKKCDVNVGLAQLLLENYEAAKANLSCADATCKTNYLLAVVGARTSNDAEVFAGLKKALAINPALKGKALNDREFIRYFDNEEFLSIVK